MSEYIHHLFLQRTETYVNQLKFHFLSFRIVSLNSVTSLLNNDKHTQQMAALQILKIELSGNFSFVFFFFFFFLHFLNDDKNFQQISAPQILKPESSRVFPTIFYTNICRKFHYLKYQQNVLLVCNTLKISLFTIVLKKTFTFIAH